MAVIVRDCPHCPATSVGFTITWAAVPPQSRPHIWNTAAICGACKKPIVFVATHTSAQNHTPPTAFNSDIEGAYIIGEIWPRRTSATAPAHVPNAIATRFLDGEENFQRGRWNPAVSMYRSALDIATKALEPEAAKKTFYERLRWMFENGRITKDIREWADFVRVDGNAALHEPDEFSEEDAKSLRYFTEMFLRYMFEMPGEVQSYRAETGAITSGETRPAS